MIETSSQTRVRARLKNKRKADGTNGASALAPCLFARSQPQILGAATFDSVSTLTFKVIILGPLTQYPHALNSLFMSLAPPEISVQKAQLRREMKTYRAGLTPDTRALASAQVCQILSAWLCSHAASHIAIYLASPLEINLDALGVTLINAGKVVCAPRVNIASDIMNFRHLTDLDSVTCGVYDVREPISDQIILPEIVLVPGLAFDRRGHRLGMGGGWYDRVLSDIPLKIGVCFGWQIVDEIPVETHDINMNWLASEMGLLHCE